MTNRYQQLSTGLKRHIAQYGQEQIVELFNRVQDRIDNYKTALEHFMDEKRYKNIYKGRVDNYFIKALNPSQLTIFHKLQNLDKKLLSDTTTDRLDVRYKIYHDIKDIKGGAVDKIGRQTQMQKILIQHTTGLYKIKQYYRYLKKTIDMLRNLQTLLSPENFIQYKDLLFIKETVTKTNELLDILSWFSHHSPRILLSLQKYKNNLSIT